MNKATLFFAVRQRIGLPWDHYKGINLGQNSGIFSCRETAGNCVLSALTIRLGAVDMNGKFWANVIVCCLLLFVFIFGIQKLSKSSITEILQPDVSKSKRHEGILEKLTIERNGVRVKRSTNQVDALFSIRNSSDYDVNNFDIICQISDRASRSLGILKWFIGETVEKGTRRTVQIENRKKFVPLSTSSLLFNCQIVDVNIIRKPMIIIKETHERVSHPKEEPKHLRTGSH